jgi:hypothetical protein
VGICNWLQYKNENLFFEFGIGMSANANHLRDTSNWQKMFVICEQGRCKSQIRASDPRGRTEEYSEVVFQMTKLKQISYSSCGEFYLCHFSSSQT